MGEQPNLYPRVMTCSECGHFKSFDSWLQLEQNPLCDACGEHATEGNGYCWCDMCGHTLDFPQVMIPLIDQHGARVGHEKIAFNDLHRHEVFVDENGTAWIRPTAWAYHQVCKARDAKQAAIAELIEALTPFAQCADQISEAESDEEWAKFRLLVKDYRRAHAAFTKAKGQSNG